MKLDDAGVNSRNLTLCILDIEMDVFHLKEMFITPPQIWRTEILKVEPGNLKEESELHIHVGIRNKQWRIWRS